MNYRNLCINCMKEKQSVHTASLHNPYNPHNTICPHCGFDESAYVVPAHVLPPFTVLNAKYLIGRVIGSGGFGITYVAMDMALERKVAIKEYFVQGSMYRSNTVSINVTVSTTSLPQEKVYLINKEKFEKEAKTLAKIDDLPGIVRVYDFFEENGTSYMTLEYLQGDTLKKYVEKAGGRIPVHEVLEKFMPAMNSMQLLHEKKILHRDISPDNIMMLEDGSLKIFDFGGAKYENNQEASVVMLAKAGYSPVEQLQLNGEQGPWTDVYAMAATMYYCICGEAPAESVSRIDKKDSLVKPRDMCVDISPKLEAVLLKGMAVKAADRYQSMREFAEALKGTKRKPSKRNYLVVILVGVVLLGAGGIALNTIRSNMTAVSETENNIEADTSGNDTEVDILGNKESVFEENEITIEKGIYQIQSYVDSNFALTITHDIYSAGVPIQLGYAGDSNTQKFWIREDEDAYVISTVCSDKAMAAVNNKQSEIVEVVQDNIATDMAGQHWYFEDAGDGAVYIRSDFGNYLSVEGASVLENVNLIMTDKKTEDCVKWILKETSRNHDDPLAPLRGDSVGIEEEIYKIIPYEKQDSVLTYSESGWQVATEADAAGEKIEIGAAEEKKYILTAAVYNQMLTTVETGDTWEFVFSGGGTYCIKSSSGKILTYVQETDQLQYIAAGDDLENVDSDQKWLLEKVELSDFEKVYVSLNSGGYIVNFQDENKALSVRNDSIQLGASLQMAMIGESSSQLFEAHNIRGESFELFNVNAQSGIGIVDTVDDSARLSDNTEMWALEPAGDGYYYIKNLSGKYLCTDLKSNTYVYLADRWNTEFEYRWKIVDK